MFKALMIATLAVPAAAWACPGHPDAAHASTAADAATPPSDPAACAKRAELVGGACSYTTGMMAQRVLAEGKPWAFTGTLTRYEGELDSHVAAPFTVGPDAVYVVANEVLESLTSAGAGSSRIGLEGRLLEVEGTKYFVLTSFRGSSV